jgi:hypothetical protein
MVTDDAKVQKVLTIVFGEGKGVVENNIGDLLEELRHDTMHMDLREPYHTRYSIGIAEMLAAWRDSDGYTQFGPMAYALVKVLKEVIDSEWKSERFDYMWDSLENLMQIIAIASVGAYNELG